MGGLMGHPRRAGVLLHPTSLPGPFGAGDIGPNARQFLDWLASANQQIWQMLPITPPDAAGSPYASSSAFARSPWLLSIDDLVTDGWLLPSEKPWGIGSPHRVDHAAVQRHKAPVLALAAARVADQVDLDAWSRDVAWVNDWACFEALSGLHDGPWTAWPKDVRERSAAALHQVRNHHTVAFETARALQWLFEQQWTALRAHAKTRGVALWGDVPFFVGANSCDVWVHRALFRVDDAGHPTVVSGVPPDAFSTEGQTWGTPLYNEAEHARTDWHWWQDRVASQAELFDDLRLDHFRGIAGVWEIPRHHPATEGRWIPGPGAGLLNALRTRLGRRPLIAEDLGVITEDVVALRDDFDLPGMAILQFAFSSATGDGTHAYLPHNHRPNSVVYTGTHDNDTTRGWYATADEPTRDHVRRYLSSDGHDISWDLARAAWHSVAQDAIVPMQDLLALEGDARMNVPGTETGNWSWRAGQEAFSIHTAARLREETMLSGRSS